MDMVNWSETVFLQIRSDIERLAGKLQIEDARFIPISAKYGDNVVNRSRNMDWYKGMPLLPILENIDISTVNSSFARFPVQTVIRADVPDFPDYRAYAGRVAAGTFRQGDEVMILPSLLTSRVKSIFNAGNKLNQCNDGECVTIILEDQIDISRGDMLTTGSDVPGLSQDIDMVICWFNNRPLVTGGKYLIRLNNMETRCIVKSINYKININNLEHDSSDPVINMNDIAQISIKCARPVCFDSYRKNRKTGGLIFIDEGTNETAGAGMIE